MRQAFRNCIAFILVAAYFFACPFVYGTLIVWCLLPIRHRDRRQRRLLAVQSHAFRGLHWVLRHSGYLEYHPLAFPLDAQGKVIVANHPTLIDIVAIMATFPNTITIVKPSIYQLWWLRPLLRQSGFIEGPGTNLHKLENMIARSTSYLERGFNIVVFPEGTRSPERSMHEFTRAAFEIACRAGADILPLAIHCSPRWLSKEHPLFPAPPHMVEFRIDPLPVVSPNDLDCQSRKLMKHARDAITQRLQEPSSPS